MKKLFNRPMKVLFCFLTAFSTFMVSAPSVHAASTDDIIVWQNGSEQEGQSNDGGYVVTWGNGWDGNSQIAHQDHKWEDGVELNMEKQFGTPNRVDSHGVIFYEWGTYQVTGLDDDTFDVILRYYFTVTRNGAQSTGTKYRSKQVVPTRGRIVPDDTSQWVGAAGVVGSEWNQMYNKNGTIKWVGEGSWFWGKETFYNIPRGMKLNFQITDVPGKESSETMTSISVNGSVTVPLKKYTVNFYDSINAMPLKKEEVSKGSNATAPANPSAIGYQFTGWDKDFTNVRSDLNVYAKWNRLNPEIKARESAYKIGDRVDLWKLQTNSKANDSRQGNITGRVEIISDVVHNGQLDTSTKGIYDVTYKITNDDDLHLDQPKSAEKHTKIHIIDPNDPLVDINLTDENIYSRYISGNEMMNGQRPVNDLKPYSVWSRTGLPNMWNILNNSLNRRTPLFTIDGVHGQ